MSVYSAIYRRSTDVISDVACYWLTFLFYLADEASVWCKILCLLQINVKMCIRMGITIFKMFIWGGISSVIWSEITFYGSAENFRPYNR